MREYVHIRILDNRLQYVLPIRGEATSRDLVILCVRVHPVLENSVKVMFKSKAVNLCYIIKLEIAYFSVVSLPFFSFLCPPPPPLRGLFLLPLPVVT